MRKRPAFTNVSKDERTVSLSFHTFRVYDRDFRFRSRNHSHNRMGLTHYLSGSTDKVDDIVGRSEEYDKLDVIFSGPVPPNPAELLLSERFDRLITELRKRYDYIIVDNVPAGMVADASIVNRVADLTIFVVRSGVMDRRQFLNWRICIVRNSFVICP